MFILFFSYIIVILYSLLICYQNYNLMVQQIVLTTHPASVTCTCTNQTMLYWKVTASLEESNGCYRRVYDHHVTCATCERIVRYGSGSCIYRHHRCGRQSDQVIMKYWNHRLSAAADDAWAHPGDFHGTAQSAGGKVAATWVRSQPRTCNRIAGISQVLRLIPKESL